MSGAGIFGARIFSAWQIVAMVFVAAGLCTSARVLAQQAGGTRVAGRVVSVGDHRPLPRAKVALEPSLGGDAVAAVTVGEDGAFAFDSVPAGKYRLVGSASGFLSSAYQEHEGYFTGIVTGKGLDTDHLELELTPDSAIYGRVTDESGEPVINGNVTLYREGISGVTRFRSTPVADDGEYEFFGLGAGRYFLSATAMPWYAVHLPSEKADSVPFRLAIDPSLDVTYPMLFYPNSLESKDATPIVVHGGDQFTANLQMLPTRSLTITVHGPPADPTGSRGAGYPQIFHTVFGVEEPVAQMMQGNDSNGEQHIVGVAPGQYILHDLPVNGRSFGRSTRFDVATESVSLDFSSPSPSSIVQANVRSVDGKPLPAGLQVRLVAENVSPMPGNADAHGVATLKDVAEGDYLVQAGSGTHSFPIVDVRIHGQSVTEKLHVSAEGGTIPVDITIATTSVNVEGFAWRDGKPAGGSTVVLFPAGGYSGDNLFWMDQSDLDGSFLFNLVPPGNYLLVAIDDGWTLHLTDRAVMQPYLLHALPVTIPPAKSGNLTLSEPAATQRR